MDRVLTILEANFFWAILGGCIMLGMVIKALTTMITTSAREKSRREIAAYIAEGSMTADQGERLMKADVKQMES